MKHALGEAAQSLSEDPVRIISHLDADGISAAAILLKTFSILDRPCCISFVHQLTKEYIKELSYEDYSQVIFLDLGSSQVSAINELTKVKRILILDHHKLDSTIPAPNILHLNPHLFSLDGSKEISSSGIVFMFALELTKEAASLAHLAVIGAIGDRQENNGFIGLNEEIVKKAIEDSNLRVTKGLRLFGSQTRPLHRVLQYSTSPFIPGVTGNEQNAAMFLVNLGIDIKGKKGWKKFNDLTEEEKAKLINAIIQKRASEKDPEDVFGFVYTLIDNDESCPTRDAKEFSTLLNACGRMNKPSLGIGACLRDAKLTRKAIESLLEYKREIVSVMEWYKNNPQHIIKHDNYMIVNARDNIRPTMVGTLASVLSKSVDVRPNILILTMAQTLDGTTKASLRFSGMKPDSDMNLKAVIKDIADNVGGESGGHQNASGCIFPTSKEEEFIENAKSILSNYAIQECLK